MLHIVQVVFAGRAEQPRIFLDKAGAESAYVEQVKKSWKQSYSTYCSQSDVDMDSFASARSFLDTLDMSEQSKINYWVANPEDAEPGRTKHLERIAQRQSQIDNLVKQVTEGAATVRESLTGLLDDLGQLTECIADTNVPPAEAPAMEPQGDAPPSATRAEPEAIDESAEKYKTEDWKTFVGSVMNVCGGGRSESPLFTRHDWRQDVYSDATSLEYWDWVAAKVDQIKEKAEKAGYTVIKDPDSPGDFKVKAPDGTVGEDTFYSELDAWCHAGMDLS